MEWEIRTFDPATAPRELWTRLHEYSNRRHRENDYPGEPPPDSVREDFMRGMPWTVLYLTAEDGEFVSVAYWRDSPRGQSVHLNGGVLAAWRRQGIATLWLRTALARMDETGRPTLAMKSAEPAAHEFFAHVGFQRVSAEGGSRLDLPGVDRSLLHRWEADLGTRAPGVRLEFHAEFLPDEALAEYMVVRNRFPDVGETRDTVGEWRTLIDRLRGSEGVNHTIFAREEDGTVSALTEVIWRPDRPEQVIQEFTGVVPEARGRGLGKALKAAMIRFVTERHPEVTQIATTNETGNAPMLSINERMGFVRTIEVVQFEISHDQLAAWLTQHQG